MGEWGSVSTSIIRSSPNCSVWHLRSRRRRRVQPWNPIALDQRIDEATATALLVHSLPGSHESNADRIIVLEGQQKDELQRSPGRNLIGEGSATFQWRWVVFNEIERMHRDERSGYKNIFK